MALSVCAVEPFRVKVPLKLIALPLKTLFAARVTPPVPAMPLPLLMILPCTVAVMPVVVRAKVLLIIRSLQVKDAGAVEEAITASEVLVGAPLLHELPFQVVVE